MSSTHHTYCRLCEVGCGLVAEVEEGRITRLRPDTEHPVTAGFACNKGLLSLDVHHDPARLDQPLRRSADGSFGAETWDEALDDIATRLGAIIAEHGPAAVAVYLGNPTAFNATAGPATGLFLLQLGSDRLFTAASQDCANKFAIGELLWGSSQTHLVADLEHTHHVLLLGTNPRISKGSFLVTPDPVAKLAAIETRGGTVRFVDPRKGEPNVGETVQIRPDTDAYLLAAMLHEIDRTVGFDPEGVALVDDLESLRRRIADYSPEQVADVVGIPAERIRSMAIEFASAPTAAIHVSTGVNMGRSGALAYWLTTMLSVLTGNLDRRGGNIAVNRATDASPHPYPASPDGFADTPWGRFRATTGGLPGALLASMIERGEPPIRALICVAGNPALSIGGGDRLTEALAGLDLLVTVDLYRNATGELADHVLPARDWFEREDLNTFVQGTQVTPFLQWSGPIVEPDADRRTEQWIFADLGERLGFPPIFGRDGDVLSMLYDGSLARHGLSMNALRESDNGVAVLEPTPPGEFLGDRTIDGDPAMLEVAWQRAAACFDELVAEPEDQLKLITRRTSHTINSALQNVARLKRGAGADNPLWLSPTDAERLGITDGARVRVSNRYGEVVAPARIDATLRPGVVAMTHGFGNATTHGQPVAQAHPGVNVNVLSPIGPGTFDPVSTMSHLTGINVEVAAV